MTSCNELTCIGNNRGTMVTQSPFPFLDELVPKLSSGLQPPAWMVDEIQRRLVLLVNHVLMQEPEAQARLRRQAGKLAEIPTVVLSAFDRSTRLLPFLFYDTLMFPAGAGAIVPALIRHDVHGKIEE